MNNVTLHIPLETAVRDKLTSKAKSLGFDSVQAYIRVWAKAEADGRELDFGDPWGQPTPEAAERLNRWTAEAVEQSRAGKLPRFTNADDLMDYLNNAPAG